MNAKLTSIAIALIATSASAFAADTGKTRAEVRAELEQAYATGELHAQREFFDPASTYSSVTRQQVRAEQEQAYAQGKSGTQTAEFVEHKPGSTGKTRAEVRAELEKAYADGQRWQQNEFYEPTQFASTRTREEVREEAIRAAQATRSSTSSGG